MNESNTLDTLDELDSLSARSGAWLAARGWSLATAESCTGGWIATTVTATAGSSEWFDRGFVSYSNEAKQELLGVQAETLQRHGAVSEEVVREMALGALARSQADVAVAVSGIAGPGGATAAKPLGTVCFAWATRQGGLHSETRQLPGDRRAVRLATVLHALDSLPQRCSA